MNNSCYYKKILNYEKGMFDKYIDVIYLLTMENSTRKEHYMKQLNKYKPHKKIIIQYNKGFKLCDKKLIKQNSIFDLNDAYYQVFIHAKKNNYKNIIIFEDDFFFDHTINQFIVDDIGDFITNNNFHVYNLGSVLNLVLPYYKTNIKCLISTSTHAVIYNHKYFEYYIHNYEHNNINIQNDLFWNKLDIIKYTYYKPICFQLYIKTENRQNWKLVKVAEFFINILKLDVAHRPGYIIGPIAMYIISFHIIYLILNFLIYVLCSI
jgi:hypothetical protein